VTCQLRDRPPPLIGGYTVITFHPPELVGAGQLNEVELENQTLKATLEDLQGRHGEVLARLESSTQGATGQLSQIADLEVTFCEAKIVGWATALPLHSTALSWGLNQRDKGLFQRQWLGPIHQTKSFMDSHFIFLLPPQVTPGTLSSTPRQVGRVNGSTLEGSNSRPFA
jgi:hypothetical protein